MITARFMFEDDRIIGFDISGHSGYAEAGSDIVCAAVSSAVSLCECAIRDCFGAEAEVDVCEASARVSLKLCEYLPHDIIIPCGKVLDALYMHLKHLQEEYPQYIEILEV